MRRWINQLGGIGISLAAVLVPLAAETNRPPAPSPAARLFPDYREVVIPPNLAPLNFKIEELGQGYRVRLHAAQGPSIEIRSRGPGIVIPLKPWRALLQANAGSNIFVDISVEDKASVWTQFATITNTVAREPVDGHLVYRLLKPLYNIYVNLGIYQRDLSTYKESVVLHNGSFRHGCVNCHTFLNHQPEPMALHIRSEAGGHPMLLVQSNEVTKVIRTAGYISWHPSGRLIAYSANKLSLFYHTVGETRDVYDAESNLGIYRVDQNRIVIPPAIARRDRQETWPSWSPDGRHLYFCSAPVLPPERHQEIRYDLMRIPYDLEKDVWGEVETLVSAKETGLSTAQPRVSPDGRFLLFCMFKYGNFPIYQPSSDLYLMTLTNRQFRRLEINSPEADTWHCWSSNGRWIVFSSKRRDGLFARPYFSYCDTEGRFSKPVMLPQEDPAFYDSFIKTYNLPELIQAPVRVKERDLAEAIFNPRKVLRPAIDTNAPPQAPSVGEADGDAGEPYYRPGLKGKTP
jgi:hypothetical protein